MKLGSFNDHMDCPHTIGNYKSLYRHKWASVGTGVNIELMIDGVRSYMQPKRPSLHSLGTN